MAATPKYKWKAGARSKVGATVAAEELIRIQKKNGDRLRAEDVVAESRPKSAPLHRAFEWDNATAGEEWRRHQARRMIQTVVIVSDDEDDETAVEAQVFFHTKDDDGDSFYVTVSQVREEGGHLESILAEIKSSIAGLRRKLSQLKEYVEMDDLDPHLRAIEKAIKKARRKK